MMNNFEQNKRCTPAEASKFRGVAGFAAQAQYGQLGRAPLRPYKMRQYWDKPPCILTKTMRRSNEFIRFLLDSKLSRKVKVRTDGRPAVVVASDAQVEPDAPPGGGALIHDVLTGNKYGGYL